MTFRFALLTLAVMILAAACTPAPTLRNEAYLNDTSLVSGEPCEAPCWQGLIPGETAWGVAQDLLDTSDLYTEVNTDRDRQTGEAWIDFAYEEGLQCCRLYTSDGETLDTILLLLAPQIPLGDVIDRHGEPTYLSGQVETPDQAMVALVYPEIPMVVYAFAENLSDAQISATSEVVGVSYASSALMDDVLATQNLYHWEGYGNLGTFIDDVFDVTPLAPPENE